MMRKSAIAASVALALGTASGVSQAAFTGLANGSYTLTITGGCFEMGSCTSFNNKVADNTADQTTLTVTEGAWAGTYGSGIAGDGVMGTIDFTLASGVMTVTSYQQDSYLNTAGGTFFMHADTPGAMTGNIDGSGNMNFTPVSRMATAGGWVTNLGVQEWNRDDATDNLGSGEYRPFTTGTSTSRAWSTRTAHSETGSALQDAGAGMWTGTLVSAGNMGQAYGGFNGQAYSEIWDIRITANAPPAVPVPAAAWLLGSGLMGLMGIARRRRNA